MLVLRKLARTVWHRTVSFFREKMNTPDNVVVVTGASQGIGAEVAKAFRKLDYRIVATARSIRPWNVNVAGFFAPETVGAVLLTPALHNA